MYFVAMVSTATLDMELSDGQRTSEGDHDNDDEDPYDI